MDLANRVYLTTAFKPRTAVTILDPDLKPVAELSLASTERLIAAGDGNFWSLEVSLGSRTLTLREYDARRIVSSERR